MLLIASIAGSASLLVGGLLTVRLFTLARRTGGIPERSLAVGFAGLCVGHPLTIASRAPGLVGTHEGSLLFTIGAIALVWSVWSLNRLPQLVFRPGRRWALGLAVLASLAGVVAAAGCAVMITRAFSTTEMVGSVRFWAVAMLASIAFPFLWNAVESALYAHRMRRQLALGLADPVTAHRFVLWAIASGTAALLLGAVAGLRLVDVPVLSPLPTAVLATGSLFASGCWWLAFFTPEAYRTRLLGTTAHEATDSSPRW